MIFCMKINKFSIVSFRLVITSHAQSTSTQKCKMKLTFCMHIQISIKLCFKLIPLILLSMARHARIMQNNKFAKSLQYLQKELSYEADGLHAESHENLLQVDTIIFDGFDQTCLQYFSIISNVYFCRLQLLVYHLLYLTQPYFHFLHPQAAV